MGKEKQRKLIEEIIEQDEKDGLYTTNYNLSTEEFEGFLKEIGGLKFAYNDDAEPIMSRYFFDVTNAWLGLVKELIIELIDAGWDKNIVQIKSKFAGLRFYAGALTEEQHNIISKYEALSYETCEFCGTIEDVSTVGNGWIYSACGKCAKDNRIC